MISGCVGPRGDGYNPVQTMSEADAAAYHRPQIEALADTAADMVTAITMNYTEEAVGIARIAEAAGMPVAISFTVETDGRLPTGQTLRAAIEQVDGATSLYPAYYMINCAHPTHFAHLLAERQPWAERIRGLRANASRKSHAELNEAAELDIRDRTDGAPPPSADGAPDSQPRRARLKMRLERLLMNLAASGGLRGVERAIAVLNARDRRLRLVGKRRGGRKWREELTAERALEIDVIPFVALQVVGLLLCIYFPSIVLWLPKLAGFLD